MDMMLNALRELYTANPLTVYVSGVLLLILIMYCIMMCIYAYANHTKKSDK